MNEDNAAVNEVEAVKGNSETSIESYAKTFDGMIEMAREFDANKFEKKSELNNCYSVIAKKIQSIRKSLGEFKKAFTEDVKVRRETYDGTPEDRLKVQEEKFEKMRESLERARKALKKG